MRVLAAAAVLVLSAASSPGIVAPAAATARALSGQAYEGTIVAPGDVHDILLEDFAPMPVTIALKAGKGSALLPDIALIDPSSLDVTSTLAPFRKDGAKSVAVKNATGITLPGRYVLQVGGKAGSTGTYLLKVSAKVAKSFKGPGLVQPPDTDSFEVLAPTESLVTLKVVKGAGSTLAPRYVDVGGSSCVAASLVLSAKPGMATFVSPLTGTWSVRIAGDGGTGGAYNWTAKVKPAKPSKKPVRVNGGAPYFAPPGPAGGTLTASAGQDVSGFAADALDLCWREVRTKGGGPKVGKNSVQCTTLKGTDPRTLAADFATDAAPDPRGFALGPTHAAAFAGGSLYGIPREGSGATLLNDTLGTVDRLLAWGDAAFHLRADGIRRYAFDGSVSAGVSSDPDFTYLDMALGGKGIVFAAEDASGDLVVATVDRDGGGFLPLATISPSPGILGLAARGPDAFFAVNNGLDGTSLLRASACSPGTALPLCPDLAGLVRTMTSDDRNVYALEDDASDGVRLRQIPRGGGESVVLFRGDGASFTISPDGLAAGGGYVFVQVDDGGTPSLYRVRRR